MSSSSNAELRTFALAGFLLASIVLFAVVGLPELLPTLFPPLRSGTIELEAVSTSGSEALSSLSSMNLTIDSLGLHRVGPGEGAWISVLGGAVSLDPLQIGSVPAHFLDAKVPIGEYNLLKVSLENVTASVLGRNVTLKTPSQELTVATVFTMTENKHVTLTVDFSYDQARILASGSFDPYFTVTVREPRRVAQGTLVVSKPFASFGPGSLDPGFSKSFAFTIKSGSELQNYLLNVKGGSADKTLDVQVNETGELWYDMSGALWFLGGNLTAGTYNVILHASDSATGPVPFAVSFYQIPSIPADMPNVTFVGNDSANRPPTLSMDEFAVNIGRAGLYDLHLGVGSGDYELLVDNNPAGVISSNRTVTVQLEQGLHTFQIESDFSGAGRGTSWSVTIVPLPVPSGATLSTQGIVATALPIIAALLFAANLGWTRFASKRGKISGPDAFRKQLT